MALAYQINQKRQYVASGTTVFECKKQFMHLANLKKYLYVVT